MPQILFTSKLIVRNNITIFFGSVKYSEIAFGKPNFNMIE